MAAHDVSLWAGVDALIERAPSLDDLGAHGLQLLAASLWRSQGRPIPPELRDNQLLATLMALAAPGLLKRARAAYDGPLLLMKGPEVASRYRDPGARYFRDLDLLAEDPAAAQRALTGAGFVELDAPEGWSLMHHHPPLGWPGVPLIIEVHRAPKLPTWLDAPPIEELMALSVPSATGIDGLLAPAPAAHALMLAAHAWSHRPLGRLGDLIDVAAMLDDDERGAAAELARRWGWARMWRITLASSDALLRGARAPWPLRTWGRHLKEVHDVSVARATLIRVAAPLSASPVRRLPRALGAGILRNVRPWPGEPWHEKVARSRKTLAHAFAEEADHKRRIGGNPWGRT